MQQKVLDKGYVDLVDHMGSDLTVCNAARVSFSKDTEWEIDEEAVARLKESGSAYHKEDVQKLGERDAKLLKYLGDSSTLDAVCTSADHSACEGACVDSHTNVQAQTRFRGE